MSNFLFNEFNEVSAKEWKQKIQFDLKGADYNETLIWQSLEGIDVKPFYHSDETPLPLDIPGFPNQWKITQELFIDNEEITNKLALDCLQRGAQAIHFIANAPFNITKVLENLSTTKAEFYFTIQFLDSDFISSLITDLKKQNLAFKLNLDSIANLVKDGNWYTNKETDFKAIQQLQKQNPEVVLTSISLDQYQNAGANCMQQIAYAIAHTLEYFSEEIPSSNVPITYKVSVGPNYFFEIAKLRALRVLHAQIAKVYKQNESCFIIAKPTFRNKTLYDYNVNMLRSTTESMSAILGGANAVTNLPYDALYHKSNEFGERIARNQLLILKTESYFETEISPAKGSYYIEALTEQLCVKALELVKEIETSGGLLSQLFEGTIQKKIKESAQKEATLFENGTLVLLGTNKHPNPMDVMKDNLELYPFVKNNPRKTIIAPIVANRLAETYEKNRIQKEEESQ